MSRNPSRSNSPAPRQSTMTESTLSSGFGDYGSPGIEGFVRPPSRSSSTAAQRGSASTFSSTTAQRGSTTTTAGRTPSTPARPASPGPRPGSSGGVRPGSSGGGRPGSSGSAGSGDSIIPTEGNVPAALLNRGKRSQEDRQRLAIGESNASMLDSRGRSARPSRDRKSRKDGSKSSSRSR
ncbi:hypothetical protein QC761_500465 [Podospora bellae-mahoneyi]|uniref:Uncharacterized protein n=1 Tax=Podospora bellae-mahoneyi TaxID=2093777 RepID=A0ABR0FC88_9PEZI|nr:hypothetical protein QC761_500465 [Podospora bellae-mahoneyi]